MNLWKKLLHSVLPLLLLINFIYASQYISVVLQKCFGSCNEKYCNFSTKCRPLNRTSKLSSIDVYFHPGIELDEPIYGEIIANKKFRTVYRQHMMRVKFEICSQLKLRTHPLFKHMIGNESLGNTMEPCPLTGHRFVKPQVSTYGHLPLIPVGEWRFDYVISKIINGTEDTILSWSDFYEVKPTSAIEF